MAMTKTQRILKLDERNDRDDAYILFTQMDEDMEPPYLMDMQILATDWQALDCPEIVTVTIEPGDKLNVEN